MCALVDKTSAIQVYFDGRSKYFDTGITFENGNIYQLLWSQLVPAREELQPINFVSANPGMYARVCVCVCVFFNIVVTFVSAPPPTLLRPGDKLEARVVMELEEDKNHTSFFKNAWKFPFMFHIHTWPYEPTCLQINNPLYVQNITFNVHVAGRFTSPNFKILYYINEPMLVQEFVHPFYGK